jgi:hypothetical protein
MINMKEKLNTLLKNNNLRVVVARIEERSELVLGAASKNDSM